MKKPDILSDERIEHSATRVSTPYKWGHNHIEEFRSVAQEALNDCHKKDLGQFIKWLKSQKKFATSADSISGAMIWFGCKYDDWTILQSQLEENKNE